MFELKRISPPDLPYLSGFLQNFDSLDPYVLSPAYFGITGRRGLWLFEVEGGGVVLAVHPNLARTVIVFPPFGTADVQTVRGALASAEIPTDCRVVWGRIMGGEPGSEHVLDWTYPVHVLDVQALANPRGERFRDYRKNLHRAKRLGLHVRPLDLQRDRDAVIDITSQWAWKNQSSCYSFGDLIAPTMHALHLSGGLPISGVLISMGGKSVGFGLWEETRPHSGLANGIAGVMAEQVRGGSEFAIQGQIEILNSRGFTELCIGGSETASLDAFKRKLCPARSVTLGSIVEQGRHAIAFALKA